MFHADNTPMHTQLLIQSVFGKNETTVILQPPFTHLYFPKLKMRLKCCHFQSIDLIKDGLLVKLCSIPSEKVPEMFQVVEETLGVVNSKWRGLFQRCYYWVTSKVSRKNVLFEKFINLQTSLIMDVILFKICIFFCSE